MKALAFSSKSSSVTLCSAGTIRIQLSVEQKGALRAKSAENMAIDCGSSRAMLHRKEGIPVVEVRDNTMQERVRANQVLALRYDKLAFDFLGLIDRARLDEPIYRAQLETMSFFSAQTQQKMRENIPLESGRRRPGKCDVLTTYCNLRNQQLIDFLNAALDDILSVLPHGTDCYRIPSEHYHVSLVMIQDFRPTDMADPEMHKSLLSAEAVDALLRTLEQKAQEAQWPALQLSLYGMRIAADGAILALFMDNGHTVKLREGIGAAVMGFLQPQYLQYKKPFIHTTLARIPKQVTLETLLELFEKQRQYFYLLDKNITEDVRAFHLAREVRWMHSEVKILKKFPLYGSQE
jgi:hypothetical protein